MSAIVLNRASNSVSQNVDAEYCSAGTFAGHTWSFCGTIPLFQSFKRIKGLQRLRSRSSVSPHTGVVNLAPVTRSFERELIYIVPYNHKLYGWHFRYTCVNY